ncbi:hypothetical protein O6H91_Y043900 [Diphasiastrum complanatum]|nr:hypothetical protein O6H91_Y043900 [Diphasiastrum complanatum]
MAGSRSKPSSRIATTHQGFQLKPNLLPSLSSSVVSARSIGGAFSCFCFFASRGLLASQGAGFPGGGLPTRSCFTYIVLVGQTFSVLIRWHPVTSRVAKISTC